MSLPTLLLILLTVSWIWTSLRLWDKRMGWVDKRIAYESSAIKAILSWLVVAGVWLLIKWLF